MLIELSLLASLKSRKFRGNSEVTEFDEFELFTGVTELEGNRFNTNDSPFPFCVNLRKIKLPPSVHTIKHSAFNGCTSLREINLNDVENIYMAAFYRCISLEINLELPKLRILENSAFTGTGIKNIISLGTITRLEGNRYDANGTTFSLCNNLETVVLPKTIEFIGGQVFVKCPNLKWVKLLANTPPTIENAPFWGDYPIYVPAASVNAYKTADGWSDYTSRIQPIID